MFKYKVQENDAVLKISYKIYLEKNKLSDAHPCRNSDNNESISENKVFIGHWRGNLKALVL